MIKQVLEITIDELRQGIKRAGAQKMERFQSAEYRSFIHQQSCIVPGCNHRCDADHTESKKWKTGSDLLLCPICNFHHMELTHNLGRLAFEKKYGVNISLYILQCLHAFFKQLGLATKWREDSNRVTRGDKPGKKSTRKNRGGLTKTCNTKSDFSRYNPLGE